MSTTQQAPQWIPVEDYAADAGMDPRELITLIMNGSLPGKRLGDYWFVARPLVVLEQPTTMNDVGWLKISACRMGSYVTAGRGELRIPLRFDDPGRPAALRALQKAMKAKPVLPLAIWLNGEHFLIDSSLWVDLSAALVEYQVLTDSSSEM